jgi:hypothetical protein
VRLIRELEKNNPHMFISDISIQSRDSDNLKHSVNLVVEWPSWKGLERIPDFARVPDGASPEVKSDGT